MLNSVDKVAERVGCRCLVLRQLSFFFTQGCECDITSMLKKSKQQIDQSVTVIASLLGQLSITRQPNIPQSLDEKCGLEQAEVLE